MAYNSTIILYCNATASDHMQSHRQRIVKELFDTEHTYISQLNTVVSVSIIICQ